MAQSSHEINFTTIDGRRVRYRILSGEANGAPAEERLPVLLVHGLGCSSDVWLPCLNAARAAGYGLTFIAPDMPGFGQSAGPPNTLGMEELADWLADFMDAVNCPRMHVFAHSMGCQIALALARRNPERVGKLVLASPAAGCRHMSAARYAAGLAADALHETALYNARLLLMCGQMGLRRYLETVAAMFREDCFRDIERIAAPTLIIRGRHDPIVSGKLARSLTDAIPNGACHVTGGVAHAVPFTKPMVFLRAAISFLNPDFSQ